MARVAAALGLPGNPVEAVDAARSKLRTRESVGARRPAHAEIAAGPVTRRALCRGHGNRVPRSREAGVRPQPGGMHPGRLVRVASRYLLASPGRRSRSRAVVNFRAHNDLLLEEYLDGVEFDVDLILEDGECVFSSVSQQSPTPEPSFQETGLHCPPDHGDEAGTPSRRAQRADGAGIRLLPWRAPRRGQVHPKGPRIVEVNARMGGGRIHQVVEAVWRVDLIDAHLRAALGVPQQLAPSRKPRCAVDHRLVYAPATGRLEALPFTQLTEAADLGPFVDVSAQVGQEVDGPDRIFSTLLAEVYVGAKNLQARAGAVSRPASRSAGRRSARRDFVSTDLSWQSGRRLSPKTAQPSSPRDL